MEELGQTRRRARWQVGKGAHLGVTIADDGPVDILTRFRRGGPATSTEGCERVGRAYGRHAPRRLGAVRARRVRSTRAISAGKGAGNRSPGPASDAPVVANDGQLDGDTEARLADDMAKGRADG